MWEDGTAGCSPLESTCDPLSLLSCLSRAPKFGVQAKVPWITGAIKDDTKAI